MKYVCTYLVSLFVVFLLFAAQIRSWTSPYNRYVFWWRPANAVAIVLDLLLIAAAVAVATTAIRAATTRWKLGRLQRLFDHLFVVAVLSGLLTLFPRFFNRHPSVLPLAWMAGMLVIGFSLARPQSRLPAYAFNVCLILSPAPFLLSAQMLAWKSWDDPARTSFTAREVSEEKAPVFVFMLDGWSYPRSTRCGQFQPLFKNVRELCEQSIVFREARSPYHHTSLSIPRFIYQNDLDLDRRDGAYYWSGPDGGVLSTQVPSLFAVSRQQGYNTYLLGWYLSYNRLLGEQVDYCRSRCCRWKGETLVGEMLLAAYRNLQFWTDPLSGRVWKKSQPDLDSRFYYRLAMEQRDEMFRIIDDCPANTFAMFHAPLPHGPHVFNPDGSYYGPGFRGASQDYHRTLEYVDAYIGEVIRHLRQAGKFDDALIVITSDHAWIEDQEAAFREEPDWNRRVPLIVKLPGQQKGEVLDGRLCTNRLRPLFDAVFRGERDTERLIALVRNLDAYAPCQSAQAARQGAGAAPRGAA